MPSSLRQSFFNTIDQYEFDIEDRSGSRFVQGYKSILGHAETFAGIAGSFGLTEWGNLDKKEIHGMVSDAAMEAAGFALDQIGDYGAMIAPMLGVEGGPWGVAATTAIGKVIDIALDKFTETFLKGEEESPLAPGDWVMIDETGVFERRRRLPGFGFGEYAEETRGKTHGEPRIGLFLNKANQSGDANVLDIESGEVLREPPNNVRRIPDSEQDVLDGTKELQDIKAQLHRKFPEDQIDTDVNIQVGEEVLYNGQLYTITGHSGGGQYGDKYHLILEGNGNRYEVLPEHVTAAINKSTSTPAPGIAGSYNSVPFGFHSGDWVWYQADFEEPDEYWLGVVHRCKGTTMLYIIPARRVKPGHPIQPIWVHTVDAEKSKDQWDSQELGDFRQAVIDNDLTKALENLPANLYDGIAGPIDRWSDRGKMVSRPKQSSLGGSGELRLRGGGYSRHGGELDEKSVASEESTEFLKPVAAGGGGDDEAYDYRSGAAGAEALRVGDWGMYDYQAGAKAEATEPPEKGNNMTMLVGAALLVGAIYFAG